LIKIGLDHRKVVFVLSSMMMLRHDEGARTVLSFEYIVVMPHHLPSDLTIDY
jgi:hypothetical protein